MRYIHGIIGCVFVVIALLHIGIPDSFYYIAMYSCGAALAFITLIPDINLFISRLLAMATTASMFFYFASFFRMAPDLHGNWYVEHLLAMGMLFGAFCMIPLLADYSCRLKADCERARSSKRGAFFSVPQKLDKHIHLS